MSDTPSSTPAESGGGAQMSNPFAGLNADKIKNAGLPIQLMLGGGIVFFIFGFFDWWSVSAGPFSTSGNAFDLWQGTISWILMIGVVVVALLMLAGGMEQFRQQLVYGAVGGSGLAVLLTLWFWGRVPSSSDYHFTGVSVGASFGLYICLLAAIAATVGAGMNLQAFMKAQHS
jgi:hypothetical protein